MDAESVDEMPRAVLAFRLLLLEASFVWVVLLTVFACFRFVVFVVVVVPMVVFRISFFVSAVPISGGAVLGFDGLVSLD